MDLTKLGNRISRGSIDLGSLLPQGSPHGISKDIGKSDLKRHTAYHIRTNQRILLLQLTLIESVSGSVPFVFPRPVYPSPATDAGISEISFLPHSLVKLLMPAF